MSVSHLAMIARSRRTQLAFGLGAVALLVILALTMGSSPGTRQTGGKPSVGTDTAVVEPGRATETPAADGAVEAVDPQVAKSASTGETIAPEAGSDVRDAGAEAGGTMLAAPQLNERIVRTAGIGLRVKRGRFESTWSAAQSVAGSYGGMVASASRSGSGDSARTGTMTLRIPSRRFDAAVDRLRALPGVRVQRLDVASTDVSEEFVDTSSRLRHDRAVEARLLALLAQTKGVGEVLAVQGRLDQVQEQIELSQGRITFLEAQTSMSTIELAMRAPAASGHAGDDDKSPLSGAFSRAADRLERNVASAIEWLGGALPMLLLLAVAAVVWRIVWRRRHRP